MTTARARSLIAAAAVAAVLAHGLSGHGLPQLSQDGMTNVAVGICLLLVTVLPIAVQPKAEGGEVREVVAQPSILAAREVPAMADARSRASPPALQRFRN